MPANDPFLPCDDEARALAQHILHGSAHAALAVTDPVTGTPGISRIAFACHPETGPLCLMSALAPHWKALQQDPHCAFMLGEPGPKGDPLGHPRLMVQAKAARISRDSPTYPPLRAFWLAKQPKAKLYIDFADFSLFALLPVAATLNAGFARAFRMTAADLIR